MVTHRDTVVVCEGQQCTVKLSMVACGRRDRLEKLIYYQNFGVHFALFVVCRCLANFSFHTVQYLTVMGTR